MRNGVIPTIFPWLNLICSWKISKRQYNKIDLPRLCTWTIDIWLPAKTATYTILINCMLYIVWPDSEWTYCSSSTNRCHYVALLSVIPTGHLLANVGLGNYLLSSLLTNVHWTWPHQRGDSESYLRLIHFLYYWGISRPQVRLPFLLTCMWSKCFSIFWFTVMYSSRRKSIKF